MEKNTRNKFAENYIKLIIHLVIFGSISYSCYHTMSIAIGYDVNVKTQATIFVLHSMFLASNHTSEVFKKKYSMQMFLTSLAYLLFTLSIFLYKYIVIEPDVITLAVETLISMVVFILCWKPYGD